MDRGDGRRLGTYNILEEIGHGGMANVYRATQPSIGRTVAIKVLPAHFLQDRTFLDRFSHEVKVIAGLQHPHILPVYDYGEQDGTPYIVMAYMPSGTLADLIQRESTLPLSLIATLIEQIASALDYAHQKGIIHRDFKPSNVLLDENGNTYLADFGIAKVAASTAALTGSQLIGTPTFMAPEMADSGGVTHLADVYALGVTLYQMLTRRVPYDADTPLAVLMAHANKPIPDVRQYQPDLPKAIQNVINRSLAKEPAKRYQSAGQLAADLRRAISEPIQPRAKRGPLSDASLKELATEYKGAGQPPKHDRRVYEPPGGITLVLISVMLVLALVAGGIFVKRLSNAHGAVQPSLTPDSNGVAVLSTSIVPTDIRATVEASVTVAGASTTPSSVASASPTSDTSSPTPSITDTPTATTATKAVAPLIVNNGDRIAFASERDGSLQIHAMDADGLNPTKISQRIALDLTPAWSPDGSRIAFASQIGGNFDIYVMNADGSNLTKLTQVSAIDMHPTWSPDGSKIAFATERDGNREIFVMNADGTNPVNVTRSAAFDDEPAWSPDGSQIAFVTNTDGNWEIYAINPDGTNPTRLTGQSATDTGPAWSPDGSQIAFNSDRDGSYDIFVMDSNGSHVANLTQNSAHDLSPAWSPDGTRIAFYSIRDGNNEIYVMNADGSNQIRLTNDPGSDIDPDWKPNPSSGSIVPLQILLADFAGFLSWLSY